MSEDNPNAMIPMGAIIDKVKETKEFKLTKRKECNGLCPLCPDHMKGMDLPPVEFDEDMED